MYTEFIILHSKSVTAEKLPEVPKDELNINLPEAPTKEPGIDMYIVFNEVSYP